VGVRARPLATINAERLGIGVLSSSNGRQTVPSQTMLPLWQTHSSNRNRSG